MIDKLYSFFIKLKGALTLSSFRDGTSKPHIKPTIENLSQAIFIVNRHAKTAPNPKFLYKLKFTALHKLIREGKAKKIGCIFQIIQSIASNSQMY